MGLHRALFPLPEGTHVTLPKVERRKEHTISPRSPAMHIFTDLLKIRAFSVRNTMHIDSALHYMAQSGVRLLFVENMEDKLVGLITSYDIMGEKPMMYLQEPRHHGMTRSHILVEHIMQPLTEWVTLDYNSLEQATVEDVIEVFKKIRHRHLIVLDSSSSLIVRGLFSATYIERELDIQIEYGQAITLETFSEIEHVLAH